MDTNNLVKKKLFLPIVILVSAVMICFIVYINYLLIETFGKNILTGPKEKAENITITIYNANIKKESSEQLGIKLKNSLGIIYITELYETHLPETMIYYNDIHLKNLAVEISELIPGKQVVGQLSKEQAEKFKYKDIAIFLGNDYAKELINQEIGGQPIILRTQPQPLSENDVKTILEKYNFYDSEWNKSGYFKNYFMGNRDGTVTDMKTNLMWQQSGSDFSMLYWEAIKYIDDELNRKGFAGYNDWRLPTIEELASLLENQKMDGDLYIDPLFDKIQRWCWSSDKCKTYGKWSVRFSHGKVIRIKIKLDSTPYVRVVRTVP